MLCHFKHDNVSTQPRVHTLQYTITHLCVRFHGNLTLYRYPGSLVGHAIHHKLKTFPQSHNHCYDNIYIIVLVTTVTKEMDIVAVVITLHVQVSI